MKILDVYNKLNEIAPFELAEEWDNCGLLLGSFETEVKTAVTCLDVTDEVINFAVENNAELIISHHPVIFDALKSIDYNGKIAKLVRNNIAVISAHTNLDAADGGVNDTLCACLDFTLTAKTADNLGRICDGVSFENGKALAKYVKEKLNSTELTYIDANKPIKRIALCSGSGSFLTEEVITKKVDAYITGELKHNNMIDLYEEGISVVMAGHFSTEVVISAPLAEKLSKLFSEINFLNSPQTPIVMEV